MIFNYKHGLFHLILSCSVFLFCWFVAQLPQDDLIWFMLLVFFFLLALNCNYPSITINVDNFRMRFEFVFLLFMFFFFRFKTSNSIQCWFFFFDVRNIKFHIEQKKKHTQFFFLLYRVPLVWMQLNHFVRLIRLMQREEIHCLSHEIAKLLVTITKMMESKKQAKQNKTDIHWIEDFISRFFFLLQIAFKQIE